MAVGICAYPFATSFGLLVFFRLIFAFGASANAAMLTSVLSDYVIYEDKGIASGFMGLFSGCGALISVLIFLKISSLLPYEVVPATKIMFVIVGVIIILVAFVIFFSISISISFFSFSLTIFFFSFFFLLSSFLNNNRLCSLDCKEKLKFKRKIKLQVMYNYLLMDLVLQ